MSESSFLPYSGFNDTHACPELTSGRGDREPENRNSTKGSRGKGFKSSCMQEGYQRWASQDQERALRAQGEAAGRQGGEAVDSVAPGMVSVGTARAWQVG